MLVEIFADVLCPWCYIGKRRFEAALARFDRRDAVGVRWRSFELAPDAPRVWPGDSISYLASKDGLTPEGARAAQARVSEQARTEGLVYDLAGARPSNSFDAHRLVHLAADRGDQAALVERLFAANFAERQPLGDHDVLVLLATEAGLDAAEVRAVLGGDDYAEAVRADEREAARLGVRAVPSFVLDRAELLSGALPADQLHAALARAYERHAAVGGEVADA